MEELKMLIEMVRDLPQLALWVLIGFFVYKIAIIGSVYGVVRLAIMKAYNVLMTPREKVVDVTYELGAICNHEGVVAKIIELLQRVKPIGQYSFREADYRWLNEAVIEKKAREKENDSNK